MSGLFILVLVSSCRPDPDTVPSQKIRDGAVPADISGRKTDSISQPVGTMNDSIITNPGTPIDPPLPPKR